MNLSRHLYEREEIKASYIVCLLNKTSLEEAYFWICELFYSFGENDTIKHVWKVYYDFYYIQNHNMKNWLETQPITEKILQTITKNLFKRKCDMSVFKARKYFETNPKPNVIYRRLPKLLDKYSKKSKKVIHAINKKDLKNVCCYLSYCRGDVPIVLDEIIGHIQPKQIVWCTHSDKFHILISEIVKHLVNVKDNNTNYFIEDKKYNYEFIDLSNLSLTRKYKIQNEYIGCFDLPRVKLNMSTDEIYRKWDVYCYNTPFWQKMFKHCNGVLKDGEVVFGNENDLEKFYELYGFEVDEYPSRSNDNNCFCDIYSNDLFKSKPIMMSID